MLRNRFCALAALCLAVVMAGAATAAKPWRGLDLFKRIEADPNNSYPIDEGCGPWMVMAMTFSGENAETQARELVHELRSRYKLTAYTHRMTFNHLDDGKTGGAMGRGRRLNYRVNELTEIAVLVGDYPTVDDPDAQKTLDRIKHLKPDCLDINRRAEEGRTDSRSLGMLRTMQQAMSRSPDDRQRGPMGHSFITANPLLPEEFFRPKGLDPLVAEMNKPVKYSLLDCPGPYTVQVATFTGRVVFDQKVIRDVQEKGKEMPSMLAEAADKAHRLTMALREKGYEAYEFHDRYASIVTVGSFSSVGAPRSDGKIEINPDVLKIMETFGADKNLGIGAAPQVGQPKTINVRGEKGQQRITLDVQPIPVGVPTRSIAADYTRPFLTQQ